MTTPLALDGNSLTIEDVYAVAVRGSPVTLSPAARDRALESRRHVERVVQRGEVAYGGTTSFGKLSDVVIPAARLAELHVNLIRCRACGVGATLAEREGGAMMLLGESVVAKGLTGARPAIAELWIDMVNAGLHPSILGQGSVGASGDFAELGHLALALIGE